MILVAIGLFFLALLSYLLFAPFFLEIDSTRGLSRFRFHYLAAAGIAYEDEALYLKLQVAWWQRSFDIVELVTRKRKRKPKAKPRKQRKPVPFRKIKGLLKSFRITRWYVMLDTGSMPWNGILYPWLYLWSRQTGKTTLINFQEENTLILTVRNSAARMLWAYLTS